MSVKAFRSNPYASSFGIISSCGIQSKALEVSVSNAVKKPLLSRLFPFFNHSYQTMLGAITFTETTFIFR